MDHKNYITLIKEKTPLIKQENILFWDLWCLNYVFEKIDSDKYDFYIELENSFNILWGYNCNSIALSDLLENENIQTITNFDNETFEDLDGFNISDKAVKEFIEGMESIISNLEIDGKVVYSAHENTINLIDVEIGGVNISKENTNKRYVDEVDAQFSLLRDVINGRVSYGFNERNIYRK